MNEKVFTDQEIEAVVRVIRAGVDCGQSDGSIALAILRYVHGEAGEAIVSNYARLRLRIVRQRSELKQLSRILLSERIENGKRATRMIAATRLLVDEVGASGPQSVEEAAARAVDVIRAERARAESAECERDRLRAEIRERDATIIEAERERMSALSERNEARQCEELATTRAARLTEQLNAHARHADETAAGLRNAVARAEKAERDLREAERKLTFAFAERNGAFDLKREAEACATRADEQLARVREAVESIRCILPPTKHRTDWSNGIAETIERIEAALSTPPPPAAQVVRSDAFESFDDPHTGETLWRNKPAPPVETVETVAEAMHKEAVALRGNKLAISVDDARSWLRRWMDGESEFSFDIATIWPDTSPRIRALIGQKTREIVTTTASTKRLTREQIANMIAYAHGNAPPSYHNDVPALVREVWRLRKRVNRIRKKLNAGGK